MLLCPAHLVRGRVRGAGQRSSVEGGGRDEWSGPLVALSVALRWPAGGHQLRRGYVCVCGGDI